MNKFKVFYYEKNGKMILFFGFYLVFFIFLGIYMRNLKANNQIEEKENIQVEEKITTYSISNLINNDYSYTIDITDNNEIIKFMGTKNNIDYGNYEYKYFLDIYNINQLLKRSKLVNSNNQVLSYELENKELNDILVTEKNDGTNTIEVYVNRKTEVLKIVLNLTNYLEKDNYQIIINYTWGEINENSVS